MKIQVNSDNTIAVDASLTRFVEDEVGRVLGRFETRLTRVEVHLKDVDKAKTGDRDKVCLIEARPAGSRPLSASAQATKMAPAIVSALGKMRRALTTFFGKHAKGEAKAAPRKRAVARKTAAEEAPPRAAGKAASKKPASRKAAPEKAAKLSPRGPKKKGIYQARRKSWPGR